MAIITETREKLSLPKILKENNLKSNQVGDNFQISCPFCDDTRFRLGIHSKTHKGQCFNCGFKLGAKEPEKNLEIFDKLLKKKKTGDMPEIKSKDKVLKNIKIDADLGDKYHAYINRETRKARSYLVQERGLSLMTIKNFKFGSRTTFSFKSKHTGKMVDKKLFEHLSIPIFEHGKLVNVKYRNLDPDCEKGTKWKRETGGKTTFFNFDALLDHSYSSIYICEAEIDCASLWNAGVRNCVGLTAGANNFPDEYIDLFKRFDKVFLCLDNDEAGDEGSKELAGRLGFDKCYRVKLPEGIKDINEYFYNNEDKCPRNDKKDFLEIVKKAKQYEVDLVKDVGDVFQDTIQAIESGKEITYSTQWENLNRLIGGGFMDGNLVVIGARSKVGKTTLCINMLLDDYKRENRKSCFISCEMNSKSLTYSLLRQIEPTYTSPQETSIDVLKYWKRVLSQQKSLKFVFPQHELLSDIDKMCNLIRSSVQRYGLKYVYFDNLLFIARAIAVKMRQDIKDAVGIITQRFKNLAEELGIVLILIVHPRKIDHDKQLEPEDLKESSSIFQDADHIILIHRKRLTPEEADVEMKTEIPEDTSEILADLISSEQENTYNEESDAVMSSITEIKVISRFASGGFCNLYFDAPSGRFVENNAQFLTLMAERKKKRKKKSSGQGIAKAA